MTYQEMLTVLKGDRASKVQLFEQLISRTVNGDSLDDGEIVILEALKKELIEKPKVIVGLEANLKGQAKVSV